MCVCVCARARSCSFGNLIGHQFEKAITRFEEMSFKCGICTMNVALLWGFTYHKLTNVDIHIIDWRFSVSDKIVLFREER